MLRDFFFTKNVWVQKIKCGFDAMTIGIEHTFYFVRSEHVIALNNYYFFIENNAKFAYF